MIDFPKYFTLDYGGPIYNNLSGEISAVLVPLMPQK